MSPDTTLLTPAERESLAHTVLVRSRHEEQYESLEQQSQAAVFGMWVFLGSEVMFFGALFLALGVYRFLYPQAVEQASTELVWEIAGGNTIVLLVSGLMMALAVHSAKLGRRRALVWLLLLTAALGAVFLALKGFEYYLDYQDYLIPGWRFQPDRWIEEKGLAAHQVRHVELFLFLYWFMTGMHAVHVAIGIGAVLTMAALAHRGVFDSSYYSPVDVTALYWHFVDLVWIFLVPLLYLQGTHHW